MTSMFLIADKPGSLLIGRYGYCVMTAVGPRKSSSTWLPRNVLIASLTTLGRRETEWPHRHARKTNLLIGTTSTEKVKQAPTPFSDILYYQYGKGL